MSNLNKSYTKLNSLTQKYFEKTKIKTKKSRTTKNIVNITINLKKYTPFNIAPWWDCCEMQQSLITQINP